jgi:hypothetical protein
MKLINKMLLCVAMLLPAMGEGISAQKTLLDVKIEPAAILIGEQAVVNLSLTTDRDKGVIVLIPQDTLTAGVEVLKVLPGDTTLIENDRMIVKQDILITSFDSALYLLSPILAIDGADTIASNQVGLKVSTVPVDVDKPEEFYDIKDVWKPPFVIADYYGWIFGILLALFLICVIGYVIKKMKNRKPAEEGVKAEPELPPYEQAMKELAEIKEMKLWQQGRNKEYYTLLTETLRRYIQRRFGINAMEMTSGEIMDMIRKDEEGKAMYDNLLQILNLSDFVKFAKFAPLPEENTLSMNNAYEAIEKTKVVEPKENAEEEKENEDSKETNE